MYKGGVFVKRYVTEEFLYYFQSGKMLDAYKYFGAHKVSEDDKTYTSFLLYAPDCCCVYLITALDFQKRIVMEEVVSGIWYAKIDGFIPDLEYKYILNVQGRDIYKADPFAFKQALTKEHNSLCFDIDCLYQWHDDIYMYTKEKTYDKPVAIYELHAGSFMRFCDGNFYDFKTLAHKLAPYLQEMHFTHVEIMPLMEHPLDASWGYQITNYYSVTTRYGDANMLMYFIDYMHQHNIGVILDWVPGHICKDDHGLYRFNGDYLYEYPSYYERENEVWGTANLDLSKGITKSFLFSNALFYLKKFHIDGFRIDAVSNIIYYQGKTDAYNKKACEFLQELSTILFKEDDRIILSAEDSSSFPNVTKPVDSGGLGFNYKWDMGWMNDTLKYFKEEPSNRKYHHHKLTFSMMYYYSEQFLLPLSHDEVVHMKGSLLNKMPGNYFEKFANYRLLIGYMMTHPGKKLLFMGSELAPFSEWNYDKELEWNLLEFEAHSKFKTYIKDIMTIYNNEKALYQLDYDNRGFSFIDANNTEQSIYIYKRNSLDENESIYILMNASKNRYEEYRFGVSGVRMYYEIFNSDNSLYGGNNFINQGFIKSEKIPMHNQKRSINIKIAPLSIIMLKMRKPYKKRGNK